MASNQGYRGELDGALLKCLAHALATHNREFPLILPQIAQGNTLPACGKARPPYGNKRPVLRLAEPQCPTTDVMGDPTPAPPQSTVARSRGVVL